MASDPPQPTTQPATPPPEPAPDQDHPARHRQGEGVTVVPDTGKRGSRPKSDPGPYPPRPTPPLASPAGDR